MKEAFGLAKQHSVKFADTATILAGEFEVIHPALFLGSYFFRFPSFKYRDRTT